MCYSSSSLLSSLLFIVKVSLYDKDSKIEFVRFESVKDLGGMELDGRVETRIEWGRGRGMR